MTEASAEDEEAAYSPVSLVPEPAAALEVVPTEPEALPVAVLEPRMAPPVAEIPVLEAEPEPEPEVPVAVEPELPIFQWFGVTAQQDPEPLAFNFKR